MEGNINMFRILLFMQFVFFIGADLAPAAVKFIPSEYLIQIFTKPEHFKDEGSTPLTFDGNVTIKFKLEKDENFDKDFQIVLNADSKTTLTEIKLEGGTSETNFELVTNKGLIIKNNLEINCTKNALKYKFFQLQVIYSSPFGSDMTGFYRSSYKDANNKTRWILTTHFEPIYARKAFPCFDQPNLKALFEVHIKVPEAFQTVLCNTALNNKTAEKDYITYRFKKTDIPMSTYLVAFTVSNFTSTLEASFKSSYGKEKYGENRKLKTYGREDKIKNNEANLAQDVGIGAITELTNYLGLGYSFEKIDLVGIPDFSAGAMENYGHISFREKSLFYNEKLSSTTTKQSNVLTVTHELVHQWFGNLVTLESWGYIWLNEAFANYFEYIAGDKLEKPETKNWNLLNQMVVNEVHLRAFEVDGLNSSRPLSAKVIDENFIGATFDDISYAKGASVLRMWNLILPDNGFQKSLQRYLADRKESFANPEHLFSAFKVVANMTEKTFKTWTEQAGYPVVEVKKINGTYHLNQTRFFWEKLTDKTLWYIPVTYSTNNSEDFNPLPSQWLYDKPISITIEKPIKWIIVNNLQAGYYRVNYDKENWKALSQALSDEKYSNIPELNRAQIVNDIFSLARSLQQEYVDYNTALTLSEYLRNETSFVVWKTALAAFTFLRAKVYGDSISCKFSEHILELIEPHFKGLNASDLDHVGKLKNVEISRWACSLDYKPCVDQAEFLYKDSQYSKFPDTQEIVLCTVIRSNKEAWKNVFEMYKKEEDSGLKIMYLTALGCTNNKTQAGEFLNQTLLTTPDIRKQDLIYVLTSVINGNSENLEITFKFIENNYEEIARDYGGINPLGKAVLALAKKINKKSDFDRLNKFAEKIKTSKEGKSAQESVENALKIANSNVLWVQQRMAQFKEFFTDSGSFVSYSFTLLLMCLLAAFQS